MAKSNMPETMSSSHKPAVIWNPTWEPIIIALMYLLFLQAVRFAPGNIAGVIVSTLISLGMVIWFTASVGRFISRDKRGAIVFLLIGVIMLPLRVLIVKGFHPALLINGWLPGLQELAFICLAGGIGGGLSYLLRSANMIPPLAAALALVDIWTVLFGGPVQRAINSPHPVAKQITNAMIVSITPSQAGASPISLGIGFADFLFIAFFVAAICRFVQKPHTYRITVQTLAGVLAVYMAVVFITGWSLPALVPMGIVMIGLHWRNFHYDRSELFAMAYAGLFIGLICGAFALFLR